MSKTEKMSYEDISEKQVNLLVAELAKIEFNSYDIYEQCIILYSSKGMTVKVDYNGTTIKDILKLAKWLDKN